MLTTPLGPGAEFDRIRAIANALGATGQELGDDCAVLEVGGRSLCLSIDTSVDGVHFRREWLHPVEIGWRAAAGALSDLAAMGAEPLGVLVALTLPGGDASGTDVELMRGVGEVCAAHGAAVLGGDLTGGPVLALSLAVVGVAERPVRRRGARPGDEVWVTGRLGGARAALTAWRARGEPEASARAAFARPEPRIRAGRWLAEAGATALIDLSDGLAGDARHLACASDVALVLELERLPLGPGVIAAASAAGEAPAAFAAQGGEDYELLATLPPGADPAGCPAPLSRIGRVEAGAGVHLRLDGRELELRGFDHFG